MGGTVANITPRVFLSYARKDGSQFAARLYRDLQNAGCTPWLDANYLKPGTDWGSDIESAINACSLMIAIVTRAYVHSEVCRAEHLRALRTGKTLIPVLFDREADRPLGLEHLQYQDFTDPGRYEESLGSLLAAFQNMSGASLPERFQATFVNAPPLPPGYVGRPGELERLRSAVIGDNGAREIALTALEGMGGVGKSVLATALCNDAIVHAAFPDGIVWVTIGRTPGNLVSQMRSVGAVFGDRAEHYDATDTSAARLRQVLRGKAVLLVLDDVWDLHHVEPFLTGESRCRTLFTSRDRTIAIALRATEVRLGMFTPDQAVSVLREWTGSFDPAFPEIARCAGHLPLAVRLAGARLRSGMTPAEWLARFRSQPLEMKLGYRSDSAQDALTACFDVSLDRYGQREQELYYVLGIFPEDLRVPIPIVWRLWRQLEPSMTQDLCRELVDDFSSLELVEPDSAGTIVLHDLLQEYALAKLNGRAAATHCRFLDSYSVQQNQWWKAENDGYFFRHAAHHFAAGGRSVQLERLVADFRWLQAKLAATDPAAVVEDFDAVGDSADLRLIQSALRMSAHVLIRDPVQLAAQLTGRLLGHPSKAAARLLASAALYARQAWLRPLSHTLKGGNSALVRTLTGHTAGVSAVILTPNETALISTSYDGTIKLWDWQRGLEQRTLSGHLRQVNALDITPDGRLLVTGSSDHSVKLWDLGSGTVIRNLKGDSPVIGVHITDGGRRVTSTWLDGRVCTWDLESGQVSDDTPGMAPIHRTVTAMSHEGAREVRFSSTGGLEVWDVPSQMLIHTIPAHPSHMYTFAVTRDGKHAFTGHDDHTVCVWDLEVREPSHAVALSQRPSLVEFLPGARKVVSTSSDGALRVWRLGRGVPARRLPVRTGPTVSLRASLTGAYLVSIGWDLHIRVIERLFGLPIPSLVSVWLKVARHISEWLSSRRFRRRMISVATTSPARMRIFFSSSEPAWSVMSLWTGSIRSARGKHRGNITALAVSTNGRYVVSGSEDGGLKLWHAGKLIEIGTLNGHEGGVSAVAISAQGKLIVSAGFADRTLKVWHASSGTQVAAFTTDYVVVSCALSLMGRRIAVSDISGQIHYLRLERGR
jgi:WD40 repeat protein